MWLQTAKKSSETTFYRNRYIQIYEQISGRRLELVLNRKRNNRQMALFVADLKWKVQEVKILKEENKWIKLA